MAASSSSFSLGSLFQSHKRPQPTKTPPSEKPASSEVEHTKEFVDIIVNDWSKLTFNVIFSVPTLPEYADKYLFYINITKLGKVANLVNFPPQWLCKHDGTNQLILFDLMAQKDGTVNINAKQPRTTRSCDLATQIQPYEQAMKPYTKRKSPDTSSLIPYSSFTDIETDNESTGSIKEIMQQPATQNNTADTGPHAVPPESTPARPSTPSKQVTQPIISSSTLTPAPASVPQVTKTSRKRSRIVSPQTVLPNKVSRTVSRTIPLNSKRSYSQAAKENLLIPDTAPPIEHMEWATTVLENRKEPNTPVDLQTWSYDSIADALSNLEGINKFTSHMLSATPTRLPIPEAIRLKFVHHDTRFFITFTQNPRTKPAHQLEYMELFENALEAYKTENNLTLTNRQTRNTIYLMLKKMLISHFLTNTNFSKLSPKAIYELIRYARGFLQIKNESEETHKQIKEEITRAIEEKLLPLPSHPVDISEEILDILPFSLPIKQRSHTRGVVNALRKIYKFKELPDTYFTKLPPLPNHYKDLRADVRKYFPIRHRSALPHVGSYKKMLADYYEIEDRIPSVYFDLPPEKQPLPTTYQELNHRVRSFFPYNPATTTTPLADIITEMREFYKFKLLPNDYFSIKLSLPSDTSKIRTKTKFTFPIKDDQEAKEFIKQIAPYYKIKHPLPQHIMQANPTNKPALPSFDQVMEEITIPFPIQTPKQLVETVKELRKHYYFTRLPDEWIQIPANSPEETLADPLRTATHTLPLPDNLPDIKTLLDDQDIELTLPITRQQDITPTMMTLRQHFKIGSIPDFILKLPPLPAPTWSIFSTNRTARPPSPSTIQTITSIPQTPEEPSNINLDPSMEEETNNTNSNPPANEEPTIPTTAEELNNTNSDPPLAETSPMDTS